MTPILITLTPIFITLFIFAVVSVCVGRTAETELNQQKEIMAAFNRSETIELRYKKSALGRAALHFFVGIVMTFSSLAQINAHRIAHVIFGLGVLILYMGVINIRRRLSSKPAVVITTQSLTYDGLEINWPEISLVCRMTYPRTSFSFFGTNPLVFELKKKKSRILFFIPSKLVHIPVSNIIHGEVIIPIARRVLGERCAIKWDYQSYETHRAKKDD